MTSPRLRGPISPLVVLAVFGAILATDAHAARLGELWVLSAPGEPLLAVIDLEDVAPGDAEFVEPSIASPEGYRSAGLAHPDALLDARASRVRRAGERWAVLVRGVRPVDVPELPLLLRLSGTGTASARVYPVAIGSAPARAMPAPAAGAAEPPAGVAGGSDALPVVEPSGAAPPAAQPAAQPVAPVPAVVDPVASAAPAAQPVEPASVAEPAVPSAVAPERAAGVPAGPSTTADPAPAASAGFGQAPARPAQRREAPPRQPAIRAEPRRTAALGADRLVLATGGRGRDVSAHGGAAAGRTREIAYEAAMSEARSRIAQLEAIEADLKRLIAWRDRSIEDARAELARLASRPADGAAPLGAAAASMLAAPSRPGVPGPPAADEGAPVDPAWYAGLGAVALGIGGLWWLRRRRASESEDVVSLLGPTITAEARA